MSLTAEAYRDQLLALAPPGLALPLETESGWALLLLALAAELGRVDERGDDLQAEADPRSALELLPDYERVCGLPDACTGSATTLQERRARVVAVLTALGGQSRAYFQAQADALDYDVTIEEYRPFIAGWSRCGDALSGAPAVRHYWRVRVHGPRVILFRGGASACGDRLGSIARAEDLECLLQRLSPAHTVLIFAYEEV
jgi:uncharacterized protein YmfQ (DUF2313 family)